jgi:hypothetical protein
MVFPELVADLCGQSVFLPYQQARPGWLAQTAMLCCDQMVAVDSLLSSGLQHAKLAAMLVGAVL